jgi:S-formylglutathione hydrolase FrmB
MIRSIVVSLFLALGVVAHAAEVPKGVAAKNIQALSFQSESLGEQRSFSILLPADYDNSFRRYPTLYLLHGYGDDNTAWSYMTNLSEYAASHEIIIVMPDGSKSWYVNSASDPKAKFEDYIVKDLMGYVDGHYRSIPLPRSRAVAGLSMGGYGAAFLGLKHYKEFAAIGAFSGALAIAKEEVPAGRGPDNFKETLMKIMGKPGSEDAAARDPFALVAKVPAASMPMIYIACGGQDFLLKSNRDFVALLADKKIPYEYHEVSPRVHAWDFWDDQIRIFLDMLEARPGFGK